MMLPNITTKCSFQGKLLRLLSELSLLTVNVNFVAIATDDYRFSPVQTQSTSIGARYRKNDIALSSLTIRHKQISEQGTAQLFTLLFLGINWNYLYNSHFS